jgi:hypothetical protein
VATLRTTGAALLLHRTPSWKTQGPFHLEAVLFIHLCEDTVGITDYTIWHWMMVSENCLEIKREKSIVSRNLLVMPEKTTKSLTRYSLHFGKIVIRGLLRDNSELLLLFQTILGIGMRLSLGTTAAKSYWMMMRIR